MVPVSKLEDCLAYRELGYLVAAERDGKQAPEFDLGNSPFSYMDAHLKGATIAITTTNGTLAIRKSVEADHVVVGAFLNISSVVNFVREQQKDVLVVCAGWKGKFNLEDTLFAGALAARLSDTFAPENDATLAAVHLYNTAKDDMVQFLANSSHVQRLKNLHILKDIAFCLQQDVYDVVPVWQGEFLENAVKQPFYASVSEN